ncbi:MAG: EI24 domain-containing protein [Cyclobacteriaceae bacterium]
MKLLQEFQLGTSAYLEVFHFLKIHQLKKLLIVPVIVNACILVILSYFFNNGLDFGLQWIGDVIKENTSEGWGFTIVDYLSDSWVFRAIVKIGRILFSFFVLSYLYRYISLVLLSPLFSYISEKVQGAISGKELPFSMKQLVKDVIRGIRIAIRNLFLELFFTLALLTLTFTGVLTPFVPIALFLVSSYYYGFAMIDYRSESKRLDVKSSFLLIKSHRGLAIGNGLIFKILLYIPILGVLFAAPLAVIAAALAMEKVDPTVQDAKVIEE